MGTAQGKPLLISSDDLEIVDIGDKLFIPVLRKTILQKPGSNELPQATLKLLNDGEVFIWYSKIVESLSLIVENTTSGGPDTLFASTLEKLDVSVVITAHVTVFDEPVSVFVPTSKTEEVVAGILQQLTDTNQDLKDSVSISLFQKLMSVLKYFQSKQGNNKQNEIHSFRLREVFGENIFAHNLAPFEISWDEYESSRSLQYLMAYRLMRGYIPLYIFDDAINSDGILRRMQQDGVPPHICQRVLQHKILWLLCVNPEDILQLPVSYFGNGDVLKELDVIELSALWYHLPKWQDISRFIWRARLKLRLDSLVFKEMMEGLEWELIRNAAYEDDAMQFYDPDEPLLKSEDSLFARQSLFSLSNKSTQSVSLSPEELDLESERMEAKMGSDRDICELSSDSINDLTAAKISNPLYPDVDIVSATCSATNSSEKRNTSMSGSWDGMEEMTFYINFDLQTLRTKKVVHHKQGTSQIGDDQKHLRKQLSDWMNVSSIDVDPHKQVNECD